MGIAWSLFLTLVFLAVPDQYGQSSNVIGQAIVVRDSNKAQNSDVVVWLEPLSGQTSPYTFLGDSERVRLAQKNKSFVPHLLVVRAGTVVDFPNLDPVFHNVF